MDAREQHLREIRGLLSVGLFFRRAGSVLALVIGLSALLLPLLRDVGGEAKYIFPAFGAFLVGLGAYGLTSSIRGRSHPFLEWARDSSERIVWVYPVEVHEYSVHTHTDVWLGRDDGLTTALRFQSGYTNLHWDSLTALFPNATVGYSEERASAFADNPEALRAC